MIKMTTPLRLLFFFLLAAGIFAACKQEPELPEDPHVPLVNPFIGVWRVDDGAAFRQFRTDGTGGNGANPEETSGDDFSFLVYTGQDVQTVPAAGILVTVSGSGGADTAAIAVYGFTVSGAVITLMPPGGGTAVLLTRVSGNPAALALSNPFIGEWTADWDGGEHGLTWSWKYRADGTAKTLHHEVKHQFENSYITRSGILVLFGGFRFGYNNQPVFGDFVSGGGSRLTVTEQQSVPSPAVWTYTRVSSAPWL